MRTIVLLLAMLLSRAAHADLSSAQLAYKRDPQRASQLLEQIGREQDGNPRLQEIRAAAQAAAGDYGAAKASEYRAIADATRLHWDLAPLNEGRARYEAGQPWFGNLLVL